DSAGNLYGTTIAGGNSKCNFYYAGCGTVFELLPIGTSWTETLLYQFTDTGGDGSDPEDGVIFDAAGNLYGVTAAGGSHLCIGGCGTVYELSPVAGGGWNEKVLYQFSNSRQDGNTPFGNVVFDAQGNLYGTTFDGGGSSACGTYGCGTVFKLTPIGGGDWTESIVNNFGAYLGDARNPRASLLLDGVGNLYGTTQAGGRATQGTVFRVQP
ncbi:MAG: hypothetical protein H0X25_22855, partial [Acidobacteriales bacterium]|nr:hypothetical protein [Terriglobales bacterium]